MQTRIHSLLEQIVNQIVGIGVAYLANLWLVPWVTGVPVSHKNATILTFVFMTMSLLRGYVVRRSFNWWQHRTNKL